MTPQSSDRRKHQEQHGRINGKPAYLRGGDDIVADRRVGKAERRECQEKLGGPASAAAFDRRASIPTTAQPSCPHDRLTEDGICRECGLDGRSGKYVASAEWHAEPAPTTAQPDPPAAEPTTLLSIPEEMAKQLSVEAQFGGGEAFDRNWFAKKYDEALNLGRNGAYNRVLAEIRDMHAETDGTPEDPSDKPEWNLRTLDELTRRIEALKGEG